MNIQQDDILLYTAVIKAFYDDFSLDKSWFITGTWEEGQESVLSLLNGKSFLSTSDLQLLKREHFSFSYRTAYVSYQDGVIDKHATYYQQRFHATEMDDIFTLQNYLFQSTSFKATKENLELLDLFHLRQLLNEEVIKLSNGEGRKAALLKALLQNPQVLILDNPTEGIDQATLPEFDLLFKKLVSKGYCIIVRSNKTQLKPSWVHRVFLVNTPGEIHVMSVDEYAARSVVSKREYPDSAISVPPLKNNKDGVVAKLTDVSVKYGDKVVLDNICWEIEKGSRWQLKGVNGAGKSTLLSLIFADHPQSYANDIEVFGIKRGSGESIWDIKEKIGYYSPEMFYYADKSQTCREAIFSGIYRNPYRKSLKEPALEKLAEDLFRFLFDAVSWELKLYQLSPVKQRLVMLIRALASNAPLMLLDEPFQGFDGDLLLKAKIATNNVCGDKTLVFVSHDPDDMPFGLVKTFELSHGQGREIRTDFKE
ncbi:MAG TPA: ATP-binding cassette domain-containing protein [Bacteroidales bacterium]|nr:ATP-binding cassette domain-containing protein [Bacteroidales bacterium]